VYNRHLKLAFNKVFLDSLIIVMGFSIDDDDAANLAVLLRIALNW
jgi:hypothetical protein